MVFGYQSEFNYELRQDTDRLHREVMDLRDRIRRALA